MVAQIAVDTNTARTLDSAVALRKRRQQDFRDGQRRFWRGDPFSLCANADERRGYDAAMEEDAEEYRRYCEEGSYIRMYMGN